MKKTKRWVNRSSNSITMVNRAGAGAHRRENKRSPDKGGPGALPSCTAVDRLCSYVKRPVIMEQCKKCRSN